MKIKIFTFFLLSLTGPVFAHDGSNGWVTLKGFKLWSNTYATETIRVQVDDGYYNPANSCTDLDSYMVASELPQEVQDRVYSTMLAALFSSRTIRAFINTSECERNRPKIMNVVVE